MEFISENHKLAWNNTLALLKPSQAQLEHGLELHRDLFCMDGFGFLPTACYNETMRRKRQEWYDRGVGARVLEKRAEYGAYDMLCDDPECCRLFRAAMRASGLKCMVQTVAEGKTREEDIRRMGCNFQILRHFRDTIAQAGSPEEIKEINDSGRIAVVWSINGPPIVGELQNPAQELSWVRDWYHLGVRLMHLSYNRRNFIADGCAEPADGGLSDLGRELIREMNKVGIIVDVPHTGLRSSTEAAQCSEKPIMASHTAARALFDFIRCKDDATLKAIAEKDGLVGVYACPGMLGGSDDLNMMLDHIVYIAKLIGADHVGIGTDLEYHHNWTEEECRVACYKNAEFNSYSWWGDWSRGPHAAKNPMESSTGSLAWIVWPLWTVGLVMRGFSDEDIAKILGRNFLRVLAANRPEPFD